MCNVNQCICCFLTVLVAIILAVYIFVDPDEDSESPFCEDIDDDSYQSATPNPDSCDINPESKFSCCALNPIIKSQMNTMLGVSSRSNCRQADGDAMCLPNLGSVYLGASVASTRDTKPYKHPLGTPESEKSNKPSLAIEPSPIVVGKNWHFVGVGTLVVRLYYPAHISGFSLVHAPKCRIPRGYESNAPKNFHVTGMKAIANDAAPFQFGNYTYDLNGPAVQIFPVQSCSKEKYQFIEFRFTSNHGNPDYTALYKVGIHGDIGPPPHVSKNAPKQGNATGVNNKS